MSLDQSISDDSQPHITRRLTYAAIYVSILLVMVVWAYIVAEVWNDPFDGILILALSVGFSVGYFLWFWSSVRSGRLYRGKYEPKIERRDNEILATIGIGEQERHELVVVRNKWSGVVNLSIDGNNQWRYVPSRIISERA